MIGEPGGDAPRQAGHVCVGPARRSLVDRFSIGSIGSIGARTWRRRGSGRLVGKFERERRLVGVARPARRAEPRLVRRPADGERGARRRRQLDQRLVILVIARREQRIGRLGTSRNRRLDRERGRGAGKGGSASSTDSGISCASATSSTLLWRRSIHERSASAGSRRGPAGSDRDPEVQRRPASSEKS